MSELFYLFGLPVLGEAFPGAAVADCKECGLAPFVEIDLATFELDAYSNQTLFYARGALLCTETFASAMATEGLTGFEARPVSARVGSKKSFGLVHLVVTARVCAADGWATPSPPCARCGERTWQWRREGIEAMTGAAGPPYAIETGTYEGHDLVRADLTHRPLISRRTRTLLEAHLGRTKVEFGPVEFITTGAEEGFDVELWYEGPQRLDLIRSVSKLASVSIGEARRLVDAQLVPRSDKSKHASPLMTCATQAEAERVCAELTAIGAKVRSRPRFSRVGGRDVQSD